MKSANDKLSLNYAMVLSFLGIHLVFVAQVGDSLRCESHC